MPALLDRQTYTATLPDGTQSGIVSGSLTLDDGAAPYVSAKISIPTPDNIAQLDPRTSGTTQPPRIVLGMFQEFNDTLHFSDLSATFGSGTFAGLSTAFGTAPAPTADYTQSFESSVDSWAAVTSSTTATQSNTAARTGSWSLRMSATGNGARIMGRTITGLTVGRAYTLTGWVLSALTGNSFRLGVQGLIDQPFVVTSTGAWMKLTYTFTATATSHTIWATGVSDTVGIYGYWDDFTLTHVVSGMFSGMSAYVTKKQWQSTRTPIYRTADLAITEVQDNGDGTLQLTLASDEFYALYGDGVQLATWAAAGYKSLSAVVKNALEADMPTKLVTTTDYDLTAAIAASPSQPVYTETIWSGLDSYVQLAGARLWSDENRVWHLDPNTLATVLTTAYGESFDDGSTGGFTSDGATLTNSTTQHHTGTRSLRVVNTGSTGNVIQKTLTGLTIGSQYTYSAWVYTSKNSTDYVTIYADTGDQTGQISSPLSAAWKKFSVTFTATATSHYIAAYLDWTSPTAASYFDDILVTTPQVPQISAQLSYGQTMTDFSDVLTRATDWANVVKVVYNWTDSAGNAKSQMDVADATAPGVPAQQLIVTYDNTPWPGAGAAAARLARVQGYGHEVSVSAVADLSLNPRSTIAINVPSGGYTGTISAVTFDFSTGVMSVSSRNLI